MHNTLKLRYYIQYFCTSDYFKYLSDISTAHEMNNDPWNGAELT